MKITRTWFKREIEITPDEIDKMFECSFKWQSGLWAWLIKVLNNFRIC